MITYQTGNATRPVGDGPKVIAHICNDIGAWGSGFVLAVSRRSPLPESAYRSWHRKRVWSGRPFELGQIQLTAYAGPQLRVANMIAQRGIRHEASAPPAVDYDALGTCLNRLYEAVAGTPVSVHMPRIGCGLGGGDWRVVEGLITDTLIVHGVPVTVYDLPGTTP